MAVLERVGPGERFCMGIWIGGLVPSAGLAADDGERVG